MDTCSSGSRKRKACDSADIDSGATSRSNGSTVGGAHGHQFRTLSASPKRLAKDSRGSDKSCQSELMCGEWLDRMSLDSGLTCSPSADMSSSGSPSSFLSVTTAGTSEPQLSYEGASQLSESPADVSSDGSCCCCELCAEPPSSVCFGTRLFAFSKDSLVRTMAAMYGFSPLCTSVGTSYFARLAARDARLMATAKAHPDFAPLVEGVCMDSEPTAEPLAQQLRMLTNAKQWLMALHLCCNYLAAKNIDKVMYRKLLTLILSHAHGKELPSKVAASLEIELLQALRWRLGPFFHEVPRCSLLLSSAASSLAAAASPSDSTA